MFAFIQKTMRSENAPFKLLECIKYCTHFEYRIFPQAKKPERQEKDRVSETIAHRNAHRSHRIVYATVIYHLLWRTQFCWRCDVMCCSMVVVHVNKWYMHNELYLLSNGVLLCQNIANTSRFAYKPWNFIVSTNSISNQAKFTKYSLETQFLKDDRYTQAVYVCICV